MKCKMCGKEVSEQWKVKIEKIGVLAGLYGLCDECKKEVEYFITYYAAMNGEHDGEFVDEALDNEDVSIVLCKDCEHLGIKDLCYGYCKESMCGIVNPYDFCSHGIRKEKKKVEFIDKFKKRNVRKDENK